MALIRAVTAAGSVGVRLLGYVFLRWIPGHPFPGLIFAAFGIYCAGLYSSIPRNKSGQKSTVKYSNIERTSGPVSLRTATWTLLLGLPSWEAKVATVASLLINTLIVLMVWDSTFSPKLFYDSSNLSFARVGFVSDTTARILVREPSLSNLPVSFSYWISELPSSAHELDKTQLKVLDADAHFDDSTDFTGVFEATQLVPDTRYNYLTSNNHSGSFKTAPSPGRTSKNTNDSFTFVHSSCTIPNFPYVPFRHHLSMPGLGHLARQLPALKAQFMIFLGDFIYIDVPRRFGIDKEAYRREYRWVYASPDWPSATNQEGHELPWIHVYDDHEIANDWDKNETGVYASAADPWQHYQVAVNPPPVRSGASYFSFVQGPASFFLMDTRRYRTPFDGTNGTWNGKDYKKSMLGPQQREDLLEWITREEPEGVKWKIIISSIPFTKNWRFGGEDTWGGYLGERQVLLEAMWQASSTLGFGFVVLSGDRHEFASTAFPPPTTGPNAGRWPAVSTVHEFSASPLSMFYLPVRTYRQADNDDVCIKYLPDGNSKFGAVKIKKAATANVSVMEYTLYIDGKEAWHHTLHPPSLR